MEYCFKVLECQFFFAEYQIISLQNLSTSIAISYKFVLKSVKSLNWIFWVIEYWFKALEYQIWSPNTKSFSWGTNANLGTLQKLSPYIAVSHKFVLKSVKSLNRMFWAMENWFKFLECQIWWANAQLFFWESKINLGTLQKLFPGIRVWYKFALKSVKSLNWILQVMQYWFKDSECQIWWTNTKLFFWESETNLGTLQKFFPYIGVSYRFVLKFVKIQTGIFLAMEDWFKALECQICLKNSISISWRNEAKLQSLQKLSPYIEVSYKFVLKSVKSLNWSFWLIEYWFKALEWQIWSTNTKVFYCKSMEKLEALKQLSPYIGASFTFCFKSVKSLNRMFSAIEYWFKALECQIWWTNTILFFCEVKTNLRTLEKFSPYIRVS